MGVEIHVLPSAQARTVKGKYVSPAEARRNRLLRKYRGFTDEECSEVDVKTLTDEEHEAFRSVVDERLAAALAEKSAAELTVIAETAEGYLKKHQPPSSWLQQLKEKYQSVSTQMHENDFLDSHVYMSIKSGSVTVPMQYIDPEVYEIMTGSPMPHPKVPEGQGGKVAEVVLQVGSLKINLGDAVAVHQETVAEPPVVEFAATIAETMEIPKPKCHTRVTFEMKNWCAVLKAMGWYPTCGHHQGYCDNWKHYSPPVK